MKVQTFSVLTAMVLVVAACTVQQDSASTTLSTTTTETSAPPQTTAPPSTRPTETTATTAVPTPSGVGFGLLQEVPFLTGGSFAGPTWQGDLDDVYVPDWVSAILTDSGGRAVLERNGFVIVPSGIRHFHHLYEPSSYDGWPVYVTTDVAYHVWHLAFDKVLREVEQSRLLPVLEAMTVRLVELARNQEVELEGTGLEEAASRVTQFYEAAATVLEVDVGPIGPLAQQEVELILDAQELTLSPTTGGDADSGFITTQVDYSLFRPRGHYTRNRDLERYFRAMSQLGNNAFLVETDALALGVLASRLVASDPDVAAQWQLIYEPSSWLVGAADDYTPMELDSIVGQTIATGWTDPTVFADPDVIDSIRRALFELRPVEINPEAASLRVMGSRFVIDSYVLDQLVRPNVDSAVASPLDLASAFGSDWAQGVQDASGAAAASGYDAVMGELQDLLASRTMEDWGATVYDAWLYAVVPMWQEYGSAYPSYMQSDAWAAKSHQTGFGSYAELKHDTILYTKQAVAEGGGEEPPVPPRHWVEPDPVVYGRLGAVTAMMRTGLDDRGLLPEQYAELLSDVEGFYGWLGDIAGDELAGVTISAEDNEALGWIGSTLEGYWIRTSDSDIDWENGPDEYAALIADIMRNPAAVLEIGTGYIDHIFVVVPDDQGGFQVAAGGVYSYYEFWTEGARLTDEEWRNMLDSGEAPERPPWQAVFLAEG